jgi:osmotically-inducible protein OsmY
MGTARKPDDDKLAFASESERDRYFMDRERRDTERYGVGQSGYTAGRPSQDPAMQFEARNQTYAGRYGDPDGDDERFTGRGGEDYWTDRRERLPDRAGGQQGLPGYGQQTTYGYGQEGFGNREYADAWSYAQRPEPVARVRPDQVRPVGGHRGKGPQGYVRSDDRIREDASQALADDDYVDATHVEVVVQNGVVLLTGTIEDRRTKKRVEAIVERVPGVRDVQNHLRLRGNPAAVSTVDPDETEAETKHRA